MGRLFFIDVFVSFVGKIVRDIEKNITKSGKGSVDHHGQKPFLKFAQPHYKAIL